MFQGHAIIENAIEHAAIALGLDPLEFRMNNLLKKGDSLIMGVPFDEEVNPIIDVIEQVKIKGKYDDRKIVVQQFNRVRSAAFIAVTDF